MLLDGRLKLRHLVLAVAIADQGSVIRAAEHLHVTQPVVTRGLQELEQILKVDLFERQPRGMTLTVFGEVFLSHARAVLAHLRQAEQHVSELADATIGTVTVGTHLAGANLLLPRAIASLKAARPHVTVVVREATPDLLAAAMLVGDVDLIIGRLTVVEPQAGLRQFELYDEPIRLVTRPGHPAQQLTAPRLATLMSYPWILPVQQTALRRELEEVFRRQGIGLPENRIECTSLLTLRRLVVETDVIAALPLLIVESDPQLALLSTPLEQITRTVGVTLPAELRPSPSTEVLLRHLYAVAAMIRESVGGSTRTSGPGSLARGRLGGSELYET